MREFWIIGGFGIVLLFGLAAITRLRIYFRTGMKGVFFGGIGLLLIVFCFLGMTILFIVGYSDEMVPVGFFLLVGVVGGIMTFLSTTISNTSESGLWVEFLEQTTFKQRLTGNVPILKYEKPPPPTVSKRTMLILGITTMTLGSLLIMVHILFRIPNFTIHIFIPGTLALIFGLLIVIFSITYLNKGKKSPE